VQGFKCEEDHAGRIFLRAILRGTHILFVSNGTDMLILLVYGMDMRMPEN